MGSHRNSLYLSNPIMLGVSAPLVSRGLQPLHHRFDARCRVRRTALVDVTCHRQRARNLPYDLRCPLGDRRCRRLAAATNSGSRSAYELRPSHFPWVSRMRSRAPLSLVTSRLFSNCANDPAIWRIITLEGSVVSVRSSPFAVSTLTPRLMNKFLRGQITGKPACILNKSRSDRLVLKEIKELLRLGQFRVDPAPSLF